MSILIVEDDNDINHLLAEILRRNGFQVTQAFSGTEGRLLFSAQSFSLVLLDLMLPGMTGEELIGVIRAKSTLPIIVLSAKDTPQDKVHVLRSGADDYITKPFHAEELLARIEANLRRSGEFVTTNSKILHFKDLSLDCEGRTATTAGVSLTLTGREFDILQLLMSTPHKVFTKANIYHSVWNDEFLGDDNTVNVHISNLRSKLGDGNYIQTVWGIGFKMCDL